MARKKKTKLDFDKNDGFGQSLGASLGLKLTPQSSAEPSEPDPVQPIPSMMIRLRLGRKGYGGKTVTECEGFEFATEAQRTDFVQTLTKSFGTRAFWKAGLLCIQGDHRIRLKPYLESLNHTVC